MKKISDKTDVPIKAAKKRSLRYPDILLKKDAKEYKKTGMNNLFFLISSDIFLRIQRDLLTILSTSFKVMS